MLFYFGQLAEVDGKRSKACMYYYKQPHCD